MIAIKKKVRIGDTLNDHMTILTCGLVISKREQTMSSRASNRTISPSTKVKDNAEAVTDPENGSQSEFMLSLV